MQYRCNLCVHFTCQTLRSLISHLGRVHKNDNGFHVLCGIDSCARTYKNFFSLRNHFIRKHGAILNGEQEPDDLENLHDGEIDEDSVDANDGYGENDGADDNDEPFNFEGQVLANKKSNVLSLLQLKDEGKIPQTVVESVIRNTTQIVDDNVELLKSGLEQCLNNADLRMEDIPGMSELFDNDNQIRKPFGECHNDASQLQFCKNNFGLVVSC